MVAALLTLLIAPPQPPTAPPPRPVGLSPALDPALADWTPRPPRGKGEPWELMSDKDWIDPRFRSMDTGPFFDCTMRFPVEKQFETVCKAAAVKIGDKGGVVFDRATLRLAAGWTGGFLNHSDRRFGLLNTPTPNGTPVFTAGSTLGWRPTQKMDLRADYKNSVPLPTAWGRFKGVHVHKDRVALSYRAFDADVLESHRIETHHDLTVLIADLEVGPSKHALSRVVSTSGGHVQQVQDGKRVYYREEVGGRVVVAGLVGQKGGGHFGGERTKPGTSVYFPPSDRAQRVSIVYAVTSANNEATFRKLLDDFPEPPALQPLTVPGPPRWGEPLVTKLERGAADGPFAVDTLTLPYSNPFKALFFCTGLDFLPDGRVAVCTCHGDVWLAKVDETAGTVAWRRFATGLYHPLGLKVIDGKVVVLERGQLTRLHDHNADGEADFYECVANDWDTGAGEHAYDTCLETDPDGNFYFFKTGDTELPTGGCLMKVSKDGTKTEVFATGFRHPIGMGMSSTGVLTGADQEGNWMPATRIDEYKSGGFYGDMRGHHRPVAPKLYDGPLCWLPRDVDNSAGGQVWVPEGTFGSLGGLPLHLSYGRCRPFVLLRQEMSGGVVQGGVAGLPIKFLSGVCRARFHPTDGMMYVCGLNGWQTAAKADGCVQRVRMTGKPFDVPVKMAVDGDTIRLTFSRPMDAKACGAEAFKAAAWNYRWEGSYGSKRWKPSAPTVEGQDEVPVKAAKLLDDGRTVELRFEKLRPVMQMQVGFNVAAGDGAKVTGSVYLTIHGTGK